jgi:HlyD family secretion protein
MKSSSTPLEDQILHTKGHRSAKRYTRIGLLLGAAVIAFFAYRSFAKPSEPDVKFTTKPVTKGDISVTVTATGNLEPTNQVTVGSELSGTMLKVFVDTNDRVKVGQVMAKLDTAKLDQTHLSLKADLISAEANVKLCQATLDETESALKRADELHRLSGGRTPSQADMDTAKAARDRAEANLSSANASVNKAAADLKVNESDLTKTEIKSPIDGIVLTRSIEPGQTVAAQFSAPELFVIAEKLETMKLDVAVSEADISKVKDGMKSTFTVDAWPDRQFSADVIKVSYASTVTDNVVTYDAELRVGNDDLSLRPGMTATADVKTEEHTGILRVPSTALRFDPATSMPAPAANQKTFMQKLTPGPPMRQKAPSADTGTKPGKTDKSSGTIWVLQDGHPKSIQVQLGITDGRMTEVSAPELKEGMEVITSSQSASASTP